MPFDARSGESRRLHPLTLAFSTFQVARALLWPALAGGFGLSGGDFALERVLPIVLGVMAVPAVIAAIGKYVFYRYRLTADELLLHSGMLSRRDRVIPLARVQNVEVRQGLAQRVFGVAELRVETAGSGAEAEAVLSVLGFAEAQAMRADLLARRRQVGAATAVPADGEAAPTPLEEPSEELARLSVGDLLVAGATANEAGVIVALLASGFQFGDDMLGPRIQGAIERTVGALDAPLLVVIAVSMLSLVLLGWVISIVGAVVRYYGFTLSRRGDELRKRYGMLTVHEASVPLARVQAIRLEESLLRRPLRLGALMIETAGGSPGQRGGAEAFVPLAERRDVARLVRGIFPELDFDAVQLQRVDPRARRRMARRYLFGMLCFWLPFWVLRYFGIEPGGSLAPYLAVLLPLPWLLAHWQYRSRGWAAPPGFVVARSGVLTRTTWMVPEGKLQTFALRETPFQRRLNLATLVVDTAAGGRAAAIIDLSRPTAVKLLDELVARVRRASVRRSAASVPG